MPEHTIAENLTRLQNATTAIGNAITAKGGTVGANDGLEEFAADIATIPSGGGGSATRKDVNFYDYDGTIVNSYTAAEFAELSAMPSNPTHDGLTAQGWNWSLSDAKTYVASYGKLDIGQMYITSDGKTRLYISLPEVRTSPILQLYLNANSELDIDWGDESTHSTFTSTSADYKSERHEYSASGNYVIAITVVSGAFSLRSSTNNSSNILSDGKNSISSPDNVYIHSIKKIEIGNACNNVGSQAFYNCYPLSSITIPNSVTSIDSNSFYGCSSLSSITIPNTVTSIDSNSFYNCYSLSSVIVPNTVTSIGQQAFYGCSSLSSITIPNTVTSIGQQAFQNCSSLSSIIVPNTVTSIVQQAFYNCFSLSSITIPNNVTSISSQAFQKCYSLLSITIPNTVTNIGSNAFRSCTYLTYIKFEPISPPIVDNANAFTELSTSTKILVPTGTLETYKSANNYPDSSTYTYEEY